MAVTFTKPVEATESATKQAVDLSEVQKLADTMGDLHEHIKALKNQLAPMEKEFKKAEAAFLKIVDTDFEADLEVTIKGQFHTAIAGAKTNKTEVTDKESLVAMLDAMTPGLAVSMASFGITDLRKTLNEAEFDSVTKTERIGKRKVSLS